LKQDAERDKAARVKLEESVKKLEGDLAHSRGKVDKYKEQKRKYKKENKKLVGDLQDLRSREHKPERRGSTPGLRPVSSADILSLRKSDSEERIPDDSEIKRKAMTYSNSSDESFSREEENPSGTNGTSSDGGEERKSDKRRQRNSVRTIKDSLKKMMQTS